LSLINDLRLNDVSPGDDAFMSHYGDECREMETIRTNRVPGPLYKKPAPQMGPPYFSGSEGALIKLYADRHCAISVMSENT